MDINLYIAIPTGILVFLTILVLKPLVHIVYLKYQLGSKANVKFFPLKGQFHNFAKNFELHGDAFWNERTMSKNPNAICLLTNLFLWPFIIFGDHTYAKEVFQNHQNYEKVDVVPDNSRLAKHGLFFTTGKKWRQQRTQLTRSFTFDILKERVPLINIILQEHVPKLDTNNFKVSDYLSSITGEIIIRSFFGEELRNVQLNGKNIQVELTSIFGDISNLQKTNIFFALGHALIGQTIWKLMRTTQVQALYQRVTQFNNLLDQMIQNRINTKKAFYEQAMIPDGCDFLDVLLHEYTHDKDKSITIQEITQQFTSFFFAGMDTTAHTVAVILYFLGKDLQAQQEMREEVQTIMGDKGFVEFSDLHNLHKLTAFIKECMRLRTPAPGMIPRRAKITHYIKDIKIQKGWMVNVSMLSMMSNGKYFNDPQEFQWKRWLDNNPLKDQSESGFIYCVFSAGGRNCIGQHLALIETKIILAHLLTSYEFTVDPTVQVRWSFAKFLYTFDPETVVQVRQLNANK